MAREVKRKGIFVAPQELELLIMPAEMVTAMRQDAVTRSIWRSPSLAEVSMWASSIGYELVKLDAEHRWAQRAGGQLACLALFCRLLALAVRRELV